MASLRTLAAVWTAGDERLKGLVVPVCNPSLEPPGHQLFPIYLKWFMTDGSNSFRTQAPECQNRPNTPQSHRILSGGFRSSLDSAPFPTNPGPQSTGRPWSSKAGFGLRVCFGCASGARKHFYGFLGKLVSWRFRKVTLRFSGFEFPTTCVEAAFQHRPSLE